MESEGGGGGGIGGTSFLCIGIATGTLGSLTQAGRGWRGMQQQTEGEPEMPLFPSSMGFLLVASAQQQRALKSQTQIFLTSRFLFLKQ
jgi:hypothetical protein